MNEDIFFWGIKALIKNNDKFLWLKKPNGSWDLPGGRINRGENFE